MREQLWRTASEFTAGLLLPLDGLAMLARVRGLLLLGVLPIALTGAAGLAAAVWLFPHREALLAFFAEAPAPGSVGSWSGQASSSLARAAWFIGSWAAWALASAGVALAVARVASAPIMDLLSKRACAALALAPPAGVGAYGDLPLARAIPSALVRALGRLLILAAGWALLLPLALVPGGALVATPLQVLWTATWLFADTTIYALQWIGPARMADVRSLARTSPRLCAGFAASLALLMLVPLAGVFVTPAAVAGACLLLARVRGVSAAAPNALALD